VAAHLYGEQKSALADGLAALHMCCCTTSTAKDRRQALWLTAVLQNMLTPALCHCAYTCAVLAPKRVYNCARLMHSSTAKDRRQALWLPFTIGQKEYIRVSESMRRFTYRHIGKNSFILKMVYSHHLHQPVSSCVLCMQRFESVVMTLIE